MLLIARQYADDMIAHALKEDPNECCGILSGKNNSVDYLYRISNSAKSPYRYAMDPQEQLDADKDSESNGWEFLAFYHSHTHSEAYPSSTDVNMALQSGYYLDVYYVLVSLLDHKYPEIRAFRIEESGAILEQDLKIS